ncbi:uncharacterized protein LOC6568718 [Drosophila grimshawi]|uniref:GH22810 n=1 Tax=Drosophila grimshawi TaxID=7222 RepID=B4JW52_DROGR|nr:uncharacterized protein LOC6568718 [Drosophila grimshawi]EDV98190.1 GH22810 [Drosophila grimshawi]
MYNSIEIPDSDDDMPEPATALAKSTNKRREADEHTPEKKRKLSAEVDEKAAAVATATTSDSDAAVNSSPANVSSSSSNANANLTATQVRHRPRKTQHTVRNAAENEIQFESIPLDDDDDEDEGGEDESHKINVHLKAPATEPLMYVYEEYMKMLDRPDVQEIIERIAIERVRCNFLLATYLLPDMNFKLNTPKEVLKNQFIERVRRKERLTGAKIK